MSTYEVNFTDINTSPIYILEQTVNDTSVDVSLFGLIKSAYGEKLQENLLHLLENFSCPEDPLNSGTPDLTKTHNNLLSSPIRGQFWHNSTNGTPYYYNGNIWVPIRSVDDIAANWGSIGHGQQLPRPISQVTGYEFPYEECIWSVSPGVYDGEFSGMNCGTDNNSRVIMEYRLIGNNVLIPGVVNYLIIGIKGNSNLGSVVDHPPITNVTPTPTPTIGAITPTPSITPTINVTPTSSPTVTPTRTVTPTPSPTQSVPIMGINTRLYTSPSPGDPGTPGGSGGNTKVINLCGPSITLNDFEQSYYISLQNLSGGVPPYTVSFRWIENSRPWGFMWIPNSNVTYEISPLNLVKSYGGGDSGAGSYERINLMPGDIPYIRYKLKFAEPELFSSARSYFPSYTLQGRVIMWDSVGASRTWWVPLNPTPVGGSDITTYPGAILYHNVGWSHYGDCNDCPDCGV